MDARTKLVPQLALLCVAFLIAACASQPKQPPRVTLDAFSLARPQGDDWLLASKSAGQVVFGKAGFSGETLALQATLIALPPFKSAEEMLRYTETGLRKDLDPARFRILALSVRPQDIQGESCALARLEAAERAVTSSSPLNSMLDTLTLTCAHPKDRRRGVSVVYSHRHYPEDRDTRFDQTGAALLETLKFEAL
jgi:hypothetical protein